MVTGACLSSCWGSHVDVTPAQQRHRVKTRKWLHTFIVGEWMWTFPHQLNLPPLAPAEMFARAQRHVLVLQTDILHVPPSPLSVCLSQPPQGFLKNERDNALLSAIEESRRRVSDSVPLHPTLLQIKCFQPTRGNLQSHTQFCLAWLILMNFITGVVKSEHHHKGALANPFASFLFLFFSH